MRYETMSKTRYLFYIPFHPVTGFEEMKFNHKGSLKLANLLCVLTCVAVVVQQVLAAFLFRRDRVEDINVLWLVAGAVGLMFLFALGNWLFCTLLDGKGRFSEIWVVTCYSMLPFVAGSIPLTLLAARVLHLPFLGVVITAYLGEDIPKSILCLWHFVSMRWLKPVTEEGREGLRLYREEE